MAQRYPPATGSAGPPGTPQPRYQQSQAPGMRPYGGGPNFPVFIIYRILYLNYI